MLTRWEEKILRKGCFIGKHKINNIKEIHITREGIRIVFKKAIGYESYLSQIVNAPCSAIGFTIPWKRDKTDSQIEDEIFLDHQQWQEESDQEYWDSLEDEMMDIQKEWNDYNGDFDWGEEY